MKTKKLIVNGLSILRIIGSLCLPIAFVKINYLLLIILLSILFITDCLDGILARKWHACTVLGSLIDPIGDKLLAIICILSLLKENNGLIFLMIFECLIIIVNLIRTYRGEKLASSIFGKVKTWGLSITLLLITVNFFKLNIINKTIIDIVFIITYILEIITLVYYIVQAIKYKNNNKKYNLKNINIKRFLNRAYDEKRFKEDKNKSLMELLCEV